MLPTNIFFMGCIRRISAVDCTIVDKGPVPQPACSCLNHLRFERDQGVWCQTGRRRRLVRRLSGSLSLSHTHTHTHSLIYWIYYIVSGAQLKPPVNGFQLNFACAHCFVFPFTCMGHCIMDCCLSEITIVPSGNHNSYKKHNCIFGFRLSHTFPNRTVYVSPANRPAGRNARNTVSTAKPVNGFQ